MIQLIASGLGKTHQFRFFDQFPNKRRNLYLLTSSYGVNPLYGKFNRILVRRLLEVNWDGLHPHPAGQNSLDPESDADIQELFRELNWQIHSMSARYLQAGGDGVAIGEDQVFENGISILLIFVRDNSYTLVRTGRFLCAVLDGKSSEIVGAEWDHFLVRSREKLGLIGDRGEEIRVPVHRGTLEDGQHLVSISASFSEGTIHADPTYWIHRIRQTEPEGSWNALLLGCREYALFGRRNKRRRR